MSALTPWRDLIQASLCTPSAYKDLIAPIAVEMQAEDFAQGQCQVSKGCICSTQTLIMTVCSPRSAATALHGQLLCHKSLH